MAGNGKTVSPKQVATFCGNAVKSCLDGTIKDENAYMALGAAAMLDAISRGTVTSKLDDAVLCAVLLVADINNVTPDPNRMTDIMREFARESYE